MQKAVVDISKIPRDLLEEAYRNIQHNKAKAKGRA